MLLVCSLSDDRNQIRRAYVSLRCIDENSAKIADIELSASCTFDLLQHLSDVLDARQFASRDWVT